MKFIVQTQNPDAIYYATVYEEQNYGGNCQKLNVGRYDVFQLNVAVQSIKVPDGVAVKFYAEADFQGSYVFITEDTSAISIPRQSIAVELAAEIFEHKDYTGDAQTLVIGSYDKDDITIGENELSSLKVPSGLAVTLFEHAKYTGKLRTYIQDCDDVGNFENETSSIIVSLAEIEIPDTTLKYGDIISIKAGNGKYLTSKEDHSLKADSETIGRFQKFQFVRSSDTKNDIFVCYGDTITVNSLSFGGYMSVEKDKVVDITGQMLDKTMKFTLYRSGDTQNGSFVCVGDTISLRSTNDKFVAVETTGEVNADNDKIDDSYDKWIIVTTPGDNLIVTPDTLPSLGCGADVCGAAVCAAATCGAAACGGAACAGAACGGAACGGAAYGIVVCGQAACGADACGAAACVADECGGQACGGAACGGAVCATASCGADVCGGYAGAIAACPIDVCGANVCGINACPCDACAADACAIDIIPIIPGI